VTETFLPLAEMQAEALNAQVRFIVIPHPLGGLEPDGVAERVKVAIEQLRDVEFTLDPPPEEEVGRRDDG
jgi:hypothetical protein